MFCYFTLSLCRVVIWLSNPSRVCNSSQFYSCSLLFSYNACSFLWNCCFPVWVMYNTQNASSKWTWLPFLSSRPTWGETLLSFSEFKWCFRRLYLCVWPWMQAAALSVWLSLSHWAFQMFKCKNVTKCHRKDVFLFIPFLVYFSP